VLRSGPDLLRSGAHLLRCPQLLQLVLQAVALRTDPCPSAQPVQPLQAVLQQLLPADLLHPGTELLRSGPDLRLRPLNLIGRC
jgi:hypothetical protein